MSTQTDTLDRLAPGSPVIVIRLRSLGDCVLSTPALQLLKETRPDLRIGVVVEDRFAAIFENHPAVEQILAPGAGNIREFAPVLCLNLHGGTRSARLTLLSGARFRAGFDIFRPGWLYNTPIPTAQEVLGVDRPVHTAEHMAAALFYLGVPIGEVPRASLAARPGRSAYAPPRPYAIVHPLAGTPEKTWPSKSFLELAEYLERMLELEVVFVGGPGDDLAAFQTRRTVAGPALGEMMPLIRDAALFVGNDSGPAHVAAAFGVPQVVLFGPTNPATWAPWRTPSEVLKAEGAIGSIPVAQVVRAVEELRLRGHVAGAGAPKS